MPRFVARLLAALTLIPCWIQASPSEQPAPATPDEAQSKKAASIATVLAANKKLNVVLASITDLPSAEANIAAAEGAAIEFMRALNSAREQNFRPKDPETQKSFMETHRQSVGHAQRISSCAFFRSPAIAFAFAYFPSPDFAQLFRTDAARNMIRQAMEQAFLPTPTPAGQQRELPLSVSAAISAAARIHADFLSASNGVFSGGDGSSIQSPIIINLPKTSPDGPTPDDTVRSLIGEYFSKVYPNARGIHLVPLTTPDGTRIVGAAAGIGRATNAQGRLELLVLPLHFKAK